MRFKMTFRIDRSLGDCLPINYQYEQSAVIYKILSNADKAYSAWLHDNGFQLDNGKHFKLFCYSRFLFEKYRIMRDIIRGIKRNVTKWKMIENDYIR